MANTAAIAQGQQPPRTRRQVSDSTIQKLFILPTLVLLILWNVFPLFYSLFLSFTRYSHSGKLPPLWIGTANYDELLSDPKVWAAFAVTGTYALLSVAGQALVGFGMALLLRAKFKASGLLTTLILIPMMLSPVVVGQFWKLIFNPLYGIFNYLIGFWNPSTGAHLAERSRLDLRGDRGRLDVEPVRHAALPLRPQGDPRLHL